LVNLKKIYVYLSDRYPDKGYLEMKWNQEQIGIIKNYFNDKPVFKANVFGSYVTEQINPDSDIDISYF
jgi:predicted nucleotidyltransferase